MEHKEASEILISLLKKGALEADEKEAVLTAIGVLAWTALSKAKIKALKSKKDRNKQWK